jgi:CHAD domain-containing protein
MPIAPERCQLLFRKLERDLRKLCTEQQAATVHSFRTTTRRLETLMEELIPGHNRKHRKLAKMLRRIRKQAGKIRDLDVQLGALRTLKVPQEPRRKTQLLEGLIELRAIHEKRLRKILTKRVARDIRKALKKSFKEVKLKNSRDPLAAAREILSGIAPTGAPVTEDMLHQWRLLVKRARYAAEFAPESTAASQFVAQLKQLQDALGHWHDWLILTHTAAERLGGIHESSLVAALHNVSGGKFRQAIAAISASPTIRSAPRAVTQPAQPSRKPRRTRMSAANQEAA